MKPRELKAMLVKKKMAHAYIKINKQDYTKTGKTVQKCAESMIVTLINYFKK